MNATTATLEDVLTQLEAWGSEKTRAVYARHGAPENQFGVHLGKVRGLAKELKTNHALALQLWATGNADAMTLATMLMDPAKLSAKECERMVKPLTYIKLIDELTYNAVAKAVCADDLRTRWMDSPKELIGRAGWNLTVARLLNRDTDGLDFDAILKQIEAEILTAPKDKQESMNRCLVEIGTRVQAFTQKCLDLGERLGRFDKRPVPKGCTSSYAPEWIAAVLKRKK